jgi:hypothetical protein
MGKPDTKVSTSISDDDSKLFSCKNMVNAFVNTTVHEKQGNDKLHLKHPKNSNRNKGTTTNSKQTDRRNDDHGNNFKIFNQNIREIKGKIDELMVHLTKATLDVICLTEPHLAEYEIDITHIPKYKLDAKFCRKNLKNGGTCIYVQEEIQFTTINIQKYYKEQDLELAAIKSIIRNKTWNWRPSKQKLTRTK